MDSPIIISDGSTHLRHPKFHQTNNGVIYINDGTAATTLTCKSYCTITTGSSTSTSTSLAPPWQLDVFDSSNTKIVTLTTQDSITISANFYANTVDITDDTTHAETLTYADINQGSLKFNKAILTNGGGSTSQVQCSDGSGEVCDMRIK
jgi:hypothetical protein